MTLKSTFVLLASVALSYALVLPSETIDKRQACTTILPTIPNYLLYQEEPTTSGVESSEVYIVDAAFQPSGRVDTLIQFTDIPARSYTCTLLVHFPAATQGPGYLLSNPAGSTQINIYVIPEPVPVASNISFSTIQALPYIWATVTLAPGESAVANTLSCPTTGTSLAFQLAFPDWITTGSFVSFPNIASPAVGLSLTYDC